MAGNYSSKATEAMKRQISLEDYSSLRGEDYRHARILLILYTVSCNRSGTKKMMGLMSEEEEAGFEDIYKAMKKAENKLEKLERKILFSGNLLIN